MLFHIFINELMIGLGPQWLKLLPSCLCVWNFAPSNETSVGLMLSLHKSDNRPHPELRRSVFVMCTSPLQLSWKIAIKHLIPWQLGVPWKNMKIICFENLFIPACVHFILYFCILCIYGNSIVKGKQLLVLLDHLHNTRVIRSFLFDRGQSTLEIVSLMTCDGAQVTYSALELAVVKLLKTYTALNELSFFIVL